MKAFLMYKDDDFDVERPLPWNESALTQDLGLDTLFQAMGLEDEFLLEITRHAVLTSESDVNTILYRQAILKDCLEYRDVVRDIYDIAVDAIECERKDYFGRFTKYPVAVLSGAIRRLEIFVELLRKLRRIVDTHGDKFESEGFQKLFAMLREELSAEFFADVGEHLKQLRFRDGVLISAKLGNGLKGVDYVLRKPADGKWNWIRPLLARREERVYTVYIHPRDQTGAHCLSELRSRGVNLVANALAQSADHIVDFFRMLRTELAFYIACTNLRDELARRGQSTCFPTPEPLDERRYSCTGLYDASLALSLERKAVGSDMNGDGKLLVIITGANQGGKSTFLRSVGLAQLMMQCGMFVPAESFRANVCDGLFTHYKREEDTTMKSGKFDEELNRMSDIVDHMTPNAMLLFNESFAATNEREGSEIARQIARALVDKRRKVFFVTHLYDFARWFYEQDMKSALFLRADRQVDGKRTFKLVEGEPLQTSFGEDLYDKIFSAGADTVVA